MGIINLYLLTQVETKHLRCAIYQLSKSFLSKTSIIIYHYFQRQSKSATIGIIKGAIKTLIRTKVSIQYTSLNKTLKTILLERATHQINGTEVELRLFSRKGVIV